MGDKSTSPYWDGFTPLSKEVIDSECLIYENLAKRLSDEWERECAKYEDTMNVKFDGKKKKKKVPRRNYVNREARIKDPSLFPYHSSCYALLDAYDNLYDKTNQQPVSKDAVPPHCFPPPPVYPTRPRADGDISGFLPCTFRSVAAAIFRLEQVQEFFDAGDELSKYMDLLMQSGMKDYVLRGGVDRPPFDAMLQTVLQAQPVPLFIISSSQCGPVDLPDDPSELKEILLKLLKHALSEIQRDHILAKAVLSRLFAEGHMEDVECLRKVLVLLASDFITSCELPCDEPEDHVCEEWENFRNSLFVVFGNVAVTLTEDHGVALAAFVRHLFLREFGHLALDVNHSFGEKMKNQLKRNLIVSREDYDDREIDDSASAIPTPLVLAVAAGLRRRACIEHERIRGFLEEQSTLTSEEKILSSIRSYKVCLSALTSIANGIVTLLPPVERFYGMASGVIFDLAVSLIGHEYDVADSYMGVEHEELASISSPFRFADNVRQAATIRAQRSFPTRDCHSVREKVLNQCRQIVLGRPPDEIRDVVRKIFLRDMVHLQDTWFGYGDFLIWCRFEVDPLDPVLLCNEFNYHIDDDESDDEESDDEDDESEEESKWDVDEDGNFLSPEELEARFGFSLLALHCAWREPWTAESHPTFQPGFRTAVHQVALSLHRLDMPKELHGHIVQYFSRDWWPDERACCFYYDCQLEQLRKEEECRETGEMYVRPPVKFCECGVFAYCSRACREADWKAGHKRVCGRPPSCRPTGKEYRLCEVIRRMQEGGDVNDVGEQESEMIVDEGDADDGSWESVDSDEDLEENMEGALTITARIMDYFKQNSYKDS
eukprot:scaffold1170_cov174-Amphora_coffeaeformis.AAC.40